MEVWRTVSVKLEVAEDDVDLLHDTIEQFREAANYVVDNARGDDGFIITDKRKLHDRTYYEVRSNTALHANLVQAARNRAAEALKSVITKWKNGQSASLPEFTSPFLDYDKRSATFHDDHASLSTIGGRVDVRYMLPDKHRDTPHSRYLHSEEYETTGATLHYRENTNEFFLHVRTRTVVDDPGPSENGTVLGVENIAVTSTGKFWSAAELNHWHREYEKRRTSMQRRGTRYAHQTILRLGEKERGRFKQVLHRVSNGVIQEAIECDCSCIAFENLSGIRDRMPNAKPVHSWAFRRLYEHVSYKAEERNIVVYQVDSRYTSQRCSRTNCGYTNRSNRPSQHRFHCQECGYTTHADYNAAKNVGFKLLHRLHKTSSGDAPVGVRVNNGMMNASGFTAAPISGRAGVHVENSPG